MAKDDKILCVENLSVDYKTRSEMIPAVRGVTFNIDRGEIYGLVGESGCGKSTVAYATMGYTSKNGKISSGEVLFKGRNIAKLSKAALRVLWGKDLAMVYQDPDSSLNPSIRVGEQIAEVLRMHKGMGSIAAWNEAIALLEKVRITDPPGTAQRYPHQISGGMKQRVCIAIALAANPDLVMMDEPTTALDVTTEAAVLDLINELRTQFQMAILYITHNLGVVARICDRVGVMYVGRLVEEAKVKDLFKNPRHPYTRGLLKCIPKLGDTKETMQLSSIPGRVVHPKDLPSGCPFRLRCGFAKRECEEVEPKLVTRGPLHRSTCDVSGERINLEDTQPSLHDQGTFQKSDEAEKSERLLWVQNLKRYFRVTTKTSGGLWSKKGLVKALEGVTFDVQKQKTLAIVGESGCGKTTLARCILGFLEPTGGAMEFKGERLFKPIEKRDRKLLKKLTVVFQNPESTLNPRHTVGYTIGRPIQLLEELSSQELNEKVKGFLKAVNLGEDYVSRYPRELSGGEKQRVAVARAFASLPELVICDEPTSALDVSVQASVLTLLLDLQRELRTSYLFISHDLSVVRYLSDYIAVMYLGVFSEVGTAEEVFNPPYHPYTEALLSAIPIADPQAEQKMVRLKGPVPSSIDPPSGCRFHTRCHRKMGKICESQIPPEIQVSETHRIQCHLPLEKLKSVDRVIRVQA